MRALVHLLRVKLAHIGYLYNDNFELSLGRYDKTRPNQILGTLGFACVIEITNDGSATVSAIISSIRSSRAVFYHRSLVFPFLR